MRRSMTAYGRAVVQTKKARWMLEIFSVNRKGLDIHLHLPHTISFMDPTLRKWIGQVAERGSVTVRVTCEAQEVAGLVQQLQSEKKRWEEVAFALKIPQDEITLSFLLSQVKLQEVAPAQQELAGAWKKASQAWSEMKKREGKVLAQDVESRLKTIRKEMKEIEKELPKVLTKYDPEEVDRADVTEEIIRLESHIQQMQFYLKSKEKSVGRTLDFLAQEMGREIGTLMAKAGSSEIAQKAVRVKSEIEKIREQVQNIE